MSFATRIIPPSYCNQDSDLGSFLSDLVEEAQSNGSSHYLSISFETDYSDPLAVLEAVHTPEMPICYMEKPSNEFSIAAGDRLISRTFSGSSRFEQGRLWANSIFQKTLIAGDTRCPGSGPTLFVAATFEAERENQEQPPPLQIFLPRWQVLRSHGSNFLVFNIEISSTSSPEIVIREFNRQLDKIRGLRFNSSRATDPRSVRVGEATERYDYEAAVEKALSEINSMNLSKIVLARQLSFNTSSPLPPFSIAHGLREKFPDCHTFCISCPDHNMMVGASPETILRASGNAIETEALAGSAPRGLSAGKDAQWGKTLFGEDKAIREHNLVIQSILRRLRSIGVQKCQEGKSRLLRLANLQHVKTPLRATIERETHPFEVLSALHPTPAMGGSPREIALPLVRKLEKHPRGWYSGVTGWLDARGRGEFIVPIRCGRISPKTLTLYAGAGLVEGSVPKQEKLETDWKLQAMLEVITGRRTLPGS